MKALRFLTLMCSVLLLMLAITPDIFAQRTVIRNGLLGRRNVNVNIGGGGVQAIVAPGRQRVIVRNGLFNRRSLNVNIGAPAAFLAPAAIVQRQRVARVVAINPYVAPQSIQFLRSRNVYLTQPAALVQQSYTLPAQAITYAQPAPQQIVQYVQQAPQAVQYVQQAPQAVTAVEQPQCNVQQQAAPDVQYQTAPPAPAPVIQKIVTQPQAVMENRYYVTQPQQVRQFITSGNCH